MKALRIDEVCEKTGLSKWQLHTLSKLGEFPQKFKITPQTVVWDEAEIDAWLLEKKEMRDGNSSRETEGEAL